MSQKPFYGWWIVASMFTAMFVSGGAGFYIFGIFYNPLMSEFGWNRADISAAVTIYLATSGLACPILGKLSDSFGARIVVLAGAFSAGITFILLSRTQTLLQFYVLYAIAGVCLSACAAVPVNSAINRWFIKKRGMAIGIAATGTSTGALLLTNMAAYFIASSGWRSAYLFLGYATWLLIIPIVFFVVKDYPKQKGLLPLGLETELDPTRFEMEPEITNELESIADVLKNPTIWLVIFSFFAIYCSMFAVLQHQVNFLSDLGISPLVAAAALGVTGGMGGFGKIFFGVATDHISAKQVMIGNYLLQAVGIIILLNTHTIAFVWTYAIIFGFAMGGQAALQPIIIGKLVGADAFGTVLGIAALFSIVGGSFAPLIAGMARDVYGNYLFVFYGCLVMNAISILSISLAGRRQQPVRIVAPATGR